VPPGFSFDDEVLDFEVFGEKTSLSCKRKSLLSVLEMEWILA